MNVGRICLILLFLMAVLPFVLDLIWVVLSTTRRRIPASVWSRFSAPPARAIELRQFFFQIAKGEEVTRSKVRIIGWMYTRCTRESVIQSKEGFELWGCVLSKWTWYPCNAFLREWDAMPAIKLGKTASQKNSWFYIVPFWHQQDSEFRQ
jgi:hypothetical protein